MLRRAILNLLLAVLATFAQSCAKPAHAVATRGCGSCHAPHPNESRACTSCHRGDARASRRELAHRSLLHGRAAALTNAAVIARGSDLVRNFACRRCHEIGSTGNRLATSLDHAVWTRSQQELEQSVAHPVETMPRFGATHEQVETLIAYLLSAADRDSADETYRVRFDRSAGHTSRFETHCGGCHRALLATGPAGRGSAGPNLSGILSDHYPATAAGEIHWTPKTVSDWIRNPRAVRERAAMRPMRIPEPEFAQLLEELR